MNDAKYIGLDVHQATISAVVLDSAGKVVMERILETKAATILQFVHGLPGSLHITFEEGTVTLKSFQPAFDLANAILQAANDQQSEKDTSKGCDSQVDSNKKGAKPICPRKRILLLLIPESFHSTPRLSARVRGSRWWPSP